MSTSHLYGYRGYQHMYINIYIYINIHVFLNESRDNRNKVSILLINSCLPFLLYPVNFLKDMAPSIFPWIGIYTISIAFSKHLPLVLTGYILVLVTFSWTIRIPAPCKCHYPSAKEFDAAGEDLFKECTASLGGECAPTLFVAEI